MQDFKQAVKAEKKTPNLNAILGQFDKMKTQLGTAIESFDEAAAQQDTAAKRLKDQADHNRKEAKRANNVLQNITKLLGEDDTETQEVKSD